LTKETKNDDENILSNVTPGEVFIVIASSAISVEPSRSRRCYPTTIAPSDYYKNWKFGTN